MEKEQRIGIVIALLMAIAYIFGIPVVWIMDRTVLSVCINAILIYGIGIAAIKVFCPSFELYRPIRWKDIKSCCVAIGVIVLVPMISLWVGLYPLKGHPTIVQIIVEGILYYICVGGIEEFFCRGVLLQAVFKTSHRALFSVLIVSVLYGIGHIPGMLTQPILVIVMRFIWTMSLGIFLGYVYIDRRNHLSLVTLMHILTDFSGIVFVFSERSWYPSKSAALIFLTYVMVGMYGLSRLECRVKQGKNL